MSTLILNAAPGTRISKGWIIDKRQDLMWFIGSSVLGYVALGLFGPLGLPSTMAFLLWVIIFDAPHQFASVTRTYFDSSIRRQLGWRLWLVIPFCFLGPMTWLLGLGPIFTLALLTWAQFHIAKQHVGFVMLYKRKSAEGNDAHLDRRLLLLFLTLPWILYVLKGAGVDVWPITALLVVPLAIAYVGRHMIKASSAEALSAQKMMLLVLIVPLHWLAFYYASNYQNGLIVAALATNMGHSLQYHRLTWFHNHNHYTANQFAGLASSVNSRFLFYLLTVGGVSLFLGSLPRFVVRNDMTLLSAFSGFSMMHYYLDSLIWKVRGNRELAAALRLV